MIQIFKCTPNLNFKMEAEFENEFKFDLSSFYLDFDFWPVTWPIRVIWVKGHMTSHDHMKFNPCGHDLYLGFLKHITWNNNIMK